MRKCRFGFMLFSIVLGIGAETGFSIGTRGGGDPETVTPILYPDQAGLDQAVDFAIERLAESPIRSDFKERMFSEITWLHTTKRYLMVPYITGRSCESSETTAEGSADESEGDFFISLGATTEFKRGAPVIFAEKILSPPYTTAKRGKLLLHEIIHHVVSLALSKDEKFVEDLASAIATGTYTRALEFALDHGFYVQPTKVSRDQFLDWFARDGFAKETLGAGIVFPSEALRRALPKNLANVPVSQFLNVLTSIPSYELASAYSRAFEARMQTMARDLNPQNPWLDHDMYFGCKRRINIGKALVKGQKACEDPWKIFMKDYYTAMDE